MLDDAEIDHYPFMMNTIDREEEKEREFRNRKRKRILYKREGLS